MQRLVIYGAGGFGREVASMAMRAGRTNLIFASDQPASSVMGIPVLTPGRIEASDEVVIAIGNSPAREKIERAHPALRWGNLFAATAIIGHDVEIGPGAVFCDHTMVTASARIGRQFQCNIYSYVAHDCVIGDFVTFAPKVSCNGNVHIHDGAYIGTGAIIRNGTHEKPLVIGENAIICMGAIITHDVPAGAKVYGHRSTVQPQGQQRAA